MTQERYERGLQVQKEVVGEDLVKRAKAAEDDFNREMNHMIVEYAFGEIWGDDTLPRIQRSFNTLCMLAVLNRPREFELHVRAAIRNGCTKDQLRALCMQITGYAGFPAGADAFRITQEVLAKAAEEGDERYAMTAVSKDDSAQGGATVDWRARGLKIREDVMGTDAATRQWGTRTDFNDDFWELGIEYGYGRIWSDDGLTRKQRRLSLLCLLAALNRLSHFEVHLRGALRDGCTREELRATFTQIAGYAGFPAGVESFRIGRMVLDEEAG